MEFTDNPDDQLEDRKLAWAARAPLNAAQLRFSNIDAPPNKLPERNVRFIGGTVTMGLSVTDLLSGTVTAPAVTY